MTNPCSLLSSSKTRFGLGVVFLALTTLVCFLNAIDNGFTNWDDPLYVVDNQLIQTISLGSIRQIFSSFLVGNYHPLTVLSLAIDYAWYGLDARGFHATNIAIHVCNVILAFAFIHLLTRNLATTFVTALLFSIHPMHVESVSWVSERKDLLYSFFYLCSLCMYLLYIRDSRYRRAYYLGTLFLFICSLLSKGQAVTLPVVLLLVDCLERRTLSRSVVAEKIPFFLLSCMFGAVAIVAQKLTGAIPDHPTFGFTERVVLACLNLFMYVAKLVAPVRLSAFYPYPTIATPLSWFMYALPAVCSVILVLLYARRLWTWLVSGQLVAWGIYFFVVNIALVLQILPVGESMFAERYTYLSSLGIFLIVGVLLSSILSKTDTASQRLKGAAICTFVMYCFWLAHTTIERNKVWRGSESLWSDVLAQFPQVVVAYLNRGSYYQVTGGLHRALADFNEGLRLQPTSYDILANRCDVHRMLGNYEQALADCGEVITRVPGKTEAYTNRGITLSILGKFDEALADFDMAISLEPKNPKLYVNRGNLFDMAGAYDTAIEGYSTAIALRKDYYAAYYNRGKTQIRRGDLQAAIEDFSVSITSHELRADSFYYRSQARKILGDIRGARADALAAKSAGRRVDESYMRELEETLSGTRGGL